MIDHEQTLQKIIDSLTNFSFEFDFEIMKKKWNCKRFQIKN